MQLTRSCSDMKDSVSEGLERKLSENCIPNIKVAYLVSETQDSATALVWFRLTLCRYVSTCIGKCTQFQEDKTIVRQECQAEATWL